METAAERDANDDEHGKGMGQGRWLNPAFKQRVLDVVESYRLPVLLLIVHELVENWVSGWYPRPLQVL